MKCILIISLLTIGVASQGYTQTWSEWFKQKKTQKKYLAVQIAKLQLYLGYVKDGYRVVNNGLRLVGDIKSGDFSLHNGYFNHLKTVSPVVLRYLKVAKIIDLQRQMADAYKQAYGRFRSSTQLSSRDVDDCYQVFSGLLDDAVLILSQLQIVLTNGTLEMTDEQRLEFIDDLYAGMFSQKSTMDSFISTVDTFIAQRMQSMNDLESIRQLLSR